MSVSLALWTHAADIEVVKSGAVKMEVDLSGFQAEGPVAAQMVAVLKQDLVRSGWFSLGTARTAAISVVGQCRTDGDRLTAACRVANASLARVHLDRTFEGAADDPARLAHRVADAMVAAVKGVPGIASTRIVFIGATGGRKDIYLCDADGGNSQRITRDESVCLSPTWDPAGRNIYYTSYHRGYPDLYRIDLQAGRRTRVSAYPGINAGAVLSPDGKRMALTLSKDGNPDIYVRDIEGGAPIRVTRTPHAAEASPSWSPDGRSLVYVSDRSGRPHLYVQTIGEREARRITFEGSQNVSPDWGPDGRIAFSSRRGGVYRIVVQDPKTGAESLVSPADADYEDPSWAPNARHIVCTRASGYRSELYILDVMGDPPLGLPNVRGEWYSPAWSPTVPYP